MALGSWRNFAILPMTARLPVTHPFRKVREKGTRSPAGLLLEKLFAFCSPCDILRCGGQPGFARLDGRGGRPYAGTADAVKICFRTGFPAGSSYVHRRK